MKKMFGNYRRLARGSLSCSSLWLGNGHLLYVKGNGLLLPLTEEYLRFELRRIHALALMRTRTGAVMNVICGSMALGGGAVAGLAASNWSRGSSPGVWAVFTALSGLVAVCWLIGLVLNVLRGPTCVVLLQTPVRCERLRPLRRLRTAQRVLAELSPIIDQAQQTATAQPTVAAPQPVPSSVVSGYQPS